MKMLTYNIEERGNKKLYEYLYLCIKHDILDGKIRNGEKLPSKRTLARNLGVSVITVENAYAQLLLEGYIISEEKKGYYVNYEDTFGGKKRKKQFQTKYTEHEYFVDFCANKTPYEFFPYSIWAKLMREVLTERDIDLLKTVPFHGMEGLRITIAEHLYETRGMTVSPDCIIIGAGIEYLYGRLLQLFGKHAVYGVEDPGYRIIQRIFEGYHVAWKPIRVDESGIHVGVLRESNANIVHISPSNQFPVGNTMPVKRRQELLKWAYEEEGRYIIEDDFDCEFSVNGRPIPTLFGMDQKERVIYMNTFSKTLISSIRISYLILPERLMERYVNTISFYSCTVSSFEQLTLEKFIKGGYLERHVTRMRNYYKNVKKKLIQEIEQSSLNERVCIQEVEAGTQILMTIKTKLSDDVLADCIKKRGVHVSFLTQHCRGDMCMIPHIMVLNYSSLEESKIKETVIRLEEAIKEAEQITKK